MAARPDALHLPPARYGGTHQSDRRTLGQPSIAWLPAGAAHMRVDAPWLPWLGMDHMAAHAYGSYGYSLSHTYGSYGCPCIRRVGMDAGALPIREE